MSDLLKLAESYYTVARDLERVAQQQLDTAKWLNRTADQMCEQNIRAQAALPCKIMEYDGAYKCVTHIKVWGAVPQPDEPCKGWVQP
jgi:hypothetical protein